MEFFKLAADQDFIPAQFGYSMCLLYGRDMTESIDDAVERFALLDEFEQTNDWEWAEFRAVRTPVRLELERPTFSPDITGITLRSSILSTLQFAHVNWDRQLIGPEMDFATPGRIRKRPGPRDIRNELLLWDEVKTIVFGRFGSVKLMTNERGEPFVVKYFALRNQ
jgi:hypothetical protein